MGRFRDAVTGLIGTPAVSITAAATMAVSIGLVTGVFSVLDTVLLAPWPYPSADRITSIELIDVAGRSLGLSKPDADALSGATGFESLALVYPDCQATLVCAKLLIAKGVSSANPVPATPKLERRRKSDERCRRALIRHSTPSPPVCVTASAALPPRRGKGRRHGSLPENVRG